jgi:DNA-3-methyladenine glycosylase II
MLLTTPPEFSFKLCLDYLKRSPKELLHQSLDESVTKAIRVKEDVVVFKVSSLEHGDLLLSFLTQEPDEELKQDVLSYVREWFDLDTDLKPFYAMARKDVLLKPLVTRFYGYRIVGQPDLFESLVWAVLGQQINLGFAYTLKHRFVETFGEKVVLPVGTFFLFPSPEVVSLITPEQLLPLQFSIQKSRYTIGIAEAFADGRLSKEKLRAMPLEKAKQHLMKIKGIGNWTANYALMKTFHHRDAFPLEDAGLHNAIRNLKRLDRKPTVQEVTKLFRKYKGWEAYATLYLWKSL